MANPVFKNTRIVIIILFVFVAIYLIAWLFVFKIFGESIPGYHAYKNGQHGHMTITHGYFSINGYSNWADYIEPPFNPLNSFYDSFTFEETGSLDTKFLALLKKGAIDTSGFYYFTINHLTIYIRKYSITGFHHSYSEVVSLSK